MQLLKRSEKSSESPHPRLPTLSDTETDEIKAKARRHGHDLSRCPTCRAGHDFPVPGVDLGWRTDSTYVDGVSEETMACDCSWQNELRLRYLLADIPEGYWRLGEEDWYGEADAWNFAQTYLDHWDEYKVAGLGMEFHSTIQGTGKTFLITYVARQLVQRGERVYYIPFRDTIGLYQMPYEARKAIEDRLEYSTVLALDEVGRALSGAQGDLWGMNFENLMRDRIDSGRVTLMTTNLSPNELDALYPRTYSLLAARQDRWAIDGDDQRRKGAPFDLLKTMAERKLQRPIQ